MATSTKKSTASKAKAPPKLRPQAKPAKPAVAPKSAAKSAPKAAKPAPKPAAASKPAKAANAAKSAKIPAPATPAAPAPARVAPKTVVGKLGRVAPPPSKLAKARPAAAPSAPAAGAPPAAAGAAPPAAAPGRPSKPPPPRLTVRTPEGADELKQKIGALATATAQIRNLKRSLSRSFFEIGEILNDIDERRLYEVKGYGSFEAFLEREIDLGKQLGMRLARAVKVFQREAAVQAGLDRVSAAIAVFDGEVDVGGTPPAATPSSSGGARSPIPFHKQ